MKTLLVFFLVNITITNIYPQEIVKDTALLFMMDSSIQITTKTTTTETKIIKGINHEHFTRREIWDLLHRDTVYTPIDSTLSTEQTSVFPFVELYKSYDRKKQVYDTENDKVIVAGTDRVLNEYYTSSIFMTLSYILLIVSLITLHVIKEPPDSGYEFFFNKAEALHLGIVLVSFLSLCYSLIWVFVAIENKAWGVVGAHLIITGIIFSFFVIKKKYGDNIKKSKIIQNILRIKNRYLRIV